MKNIISFNDFKVKELFDYLTDVRKFLDTKFNGQSNRQCIRSTYFLKNILGGKICGGWVSSNPSEHEKGGFKDKTGKWNFHYWLEVKGFIIDITADQFGDDSIIITDKKDKRYLDNGDAYNKKQDFKYTPEVVDEWIDVFLKTHNKFKI